MKKILAALTVAIVIALGTMTGVSAGTCPKPTCVTYVVAFRTPTGHEADEPVHFCGIGITPGSWYCPAKDGKIGPGTVEHCRKEG